MPRPVAAWWVKYGSGAADAGSQNLTPTNVTAVGWSGGFNGKDSQMTTSGPVLDTGPGGSFTIAAAVFLVDTASFETIVSQDGTRNSAFYLQYSSADKRWAFSRVASDQPNPAAARALSLAPPATLKWVQLVGVFNARTSELKLYVDSKLQSTVSYRTPYATHGKFALGRGQYLGASADWFHGDIGDVKVYAQALTTAQVQKIPW